MIKEHDCVVLTSDLPSEGLLSGDVGTVVHVHRNVVRVRGGVRHPHRKDDRCRHCTAIAVPADWPPRHQPRARGAGCLIESPRGGLCRTG